MQGNWILMVNAGGQLRYSPWENPKSVQALLSTAVDDLVGELAEHLDEFRAPTSMPGAGRGGC